MANDEVLGPRKTILVLVIVVGCFAVLWPRILSPLIVGHTQEQIKPNKFDREAGCCEVIFQTEVAVLELVNEVCNSVLGIEKLSPQSAVECRKAVNETCGVDIVTFLKKDENVGKTTKMLVEAMKNTNSSCLREHFGVPIYSFSTHTPINSWTLQDSVKQERPLLGVGPHPALRERGRAIPPGLPPPDRQQMPPHVRPPPIPGMRPPLGSPGGPVAAPKSTMGFLMPIYTTCIIVFFVFTLSKILFKRTAIPYNSVTPDPEFRRRVFRDDSRTTPDKFVVTAISGLVAEVQQQMEASQQRQVLHEDSRDKLTRVQTNGTVLLNTGPVQIVTSEYQEPKEQNSESAKSKQNLSECKDTLNFESHSIKDTQGNTLIKNLTSIKEETVQIKGNVHPVEQPDINTELITSEPIISTDETNKENETSTERRKFSSESNPLEEEEYSKEKNNISLSEIIQSITIQDNLSLIQSETPSEPNSDQSLEFGRPKDLNEADLELDETSKGLDMVTLELKNSFTEYKKIFAEQQIVPDGTKDLLNEPNDSCMIPPKASIDQAEPLSELKKISETIESIEPRIQITSLPRQSSNESNQDHHLEKQNENKIIDEKDPSEEKEIFVKDSSIEKELKELYDSSSDDDVMPELLHDKEDTEVSISPEPEACITPDREPPNVDEQSFGPKIKQSSKESTSDEELIILDSKEFTPEPNKSLSDPVTAAATENEEEHYDIKTHAKETTDKENLVVDNLNNDNSTNNDTIAKSTEDFLKEEREVATKDGPSTPELLAEALKEDSPNNDAEDNEGSALKVLGMEVTAHPVDGSTWAGQRPLAPPKPPQEHKAEDVKSIFLETEIPQQSRVLVTDFEDRAHTQKPTKNAPLVVSGKMTLSLIQDAPRDTPERDLESTVDEFTTASAMTQLPDEKEDLSDEEVEEELEVEEIEESEEEEVEEKTRKNMK